MSFEAIAPRIGEVLAGDVSRYMSKENLAARFVDVLVLGPIGGMPTCARVELREKRNGRGKILALVCPLCGTTRTKLLADGAGGLGCAGCLKRRTRRQAEVSLASWHHLGGELEDRLHRLLAEARNSPARRELAARLADELVAGDEDRFAALQPSIRAALDLTDGGAHGVLEEETEVDDG